MRRLLRSFALVLFLLCVSLVFPSCSLFHRSGKGYQASRPPQGEFVSPGSDIEAALRDVVRKQVQETDNVPTNIPPQHARLVYVRPYYYKEAVVYPEGTNNMDVEITPADSVTEPYTAIVKVPKVVFVTEPRRKQQQAENDTNFKRLTGVNTFYFTFKNGRWINAGSHFEATRTEEYAEGTWTPVKEKEVQTFAQPKQEEGILGRFWSSVFGR